MTALIALLGEAKSGHLIYRKGTAMTKQVEDMKRGYQHRQCSRCGEDLAYQEGNPCDHCDDIELFVSPTPQFGSAKGVIEMREDKATHSQPDRQLIAQLVEALDETVKMVGYAVTANMVMSDTSLTMVKAHAALTAARVASEEEKAIRQAERKAEIMEVMEIESVIDRTIGRLDRLLSEFLLLVDGPVDQADAQTLKHHADDLIGVGTAALGRLKKQGVQ